MTKKIAAVALLALLGVPACASSSGYNPAALNPQKARVIVTRGGWSLTASKLDAGPEGQDRDLPASSWRAYDIAPGKITLRLDGMNRPPIELKAGETRVFNITAWGGGTSINWISNGKSPVPIFGGSAASGWEFEELTGDRAAQVLARREQVN